MKCPHCQCLTMKTDRHCRECGLDLTHHGSRMGAWGWGFLLLCLSIAVITAGQLIPLAIAVGGMLGCVVFARLIPAPTFVRFLGCVGVTGCCWLSSWPYMTAGWLLWTALFNGSIPPEWGGPQVGPTVIHLQGSEPKPTVPAGGLRSAPKIIKLDEGEIPPTEPSPANR